MSLGKNESSSTECLYLTIVDVYYGSFKIDSYEVR